MQKTTRTICRQYQTAILDYYTALKQLIIIGWTCDEAISLLTMSWK